MNKSLHLFVSKYFGEGVSTSTDVKLGIKTLSLFCFISWRVCLYPNLCQPRPLHLNPLSANIQLYKNIDILGSKWDGNAESNSTWIRACFGIRGVSKHTGSNPVYGLSVGWASTLGATVS
ncbi:hypothetical protein E2C01_045040 [Portunus trituberculatus]|uniref:Uncharacterized protein n=1 Tax=Portunus trituberculatus TaxID=210409 RepID=A0A5B7G107_PORTR|nr:hypothetical protein [Portunus trituberculatus]